MIQVYFLKSYKEYKIGDLISISNNVAHGLSERGIVKILNSDSISESIKKPELGLSKAFDQAPSRVPLRLKKRSERNK